MRIRRDDRTKLRLGSEDSKVTVIKVHIDVLYFCFFMFECYDNNSEIFHY